MTAAATTRRTYEGWFTPAARLVLGHGPRDGWTVEAGARTLIAVYSSERQRDAYDKAVFTDELVLEVADGELVAGASLMLAACNARYQRGGSKLEYVSRTVTGELRLDKVDAGELRGTFSLRATGPELDVRGLGEVEAIGKFLIDQKRR